MRLTSPMKRGEVWWVEFDPAVGSEIRKTRPAVIVSNDAANRHLARVVVIPLTSNTGRRYPGEALETVGGQSSKAMADQIMAADKARLKKQLGELSAADLLALEDAVRVHLGLHHEISARPAMSKANCTLRFKQTHNARCRACRCGAAFFTSAVTGAACTFPA